MLDQCLCPDTYNETTRLAPDPPNFFALQCHIFTPPLPIYFCHSLHNSSNTSCPCLVPSSPAKPLIIRSGCSSRPYSRVVYMCLPRLVCIAQLEPGRSRAVGRRFLGGEDGVAAAFSVARLHHSLTHFLVIFQDFGLSWPASMALRWKPMARFATPPCHLWVAVSALISICQASILGKRSLGVVARG